MACRPVWLLAALGVVVITSARAQAQSRVDVTASLGWFHLNSKDYPYAPGRGPEWPTATPARHVAAGYFWTGCTKSEFDVGWNGTRTDVFDQIPACPMVGGVIRCDLVAAPQTFLTHNYRLVRLSLAQTFQPSRRSGFRPYIGAGVAFYVEREQDGRLTCSPTRPCRGEGVLEGPASVRKTAHAFATIGFKAGHPLFFMHELRVGGPEGWSLRIGFGAGR